MLKFLYIVAIGLLFAAVVGLGFQAFYPQPKNPEYPTELYTPASLDGQTAEQEANRKTYEQKSKDFQGAIEDYSRNLSMMLIATALIILAISILGLGKLAVIGDGLTLGGVFTLFYGLIRSFTSGNEILQFLAVLFGLVVLVFLSYWEFIRKPKLNPISTEVQEKSA